MSNANARSLTVFSFDAAFREAKKTGPQFELFGHSYELPASLPVGVVLEVQRLQRAEEGEQANVIELLDRVYSTARWMGTVAGEAPRPGYTDHRGEYHPSSTVQSWIDQGLTVEQMVELLRWAFSQYGSGSQEAGDAPLAASPRVKRGRA